MHEPSSSGAARRLYEATAPSNIALVKYWGKRDAKLQIPANSSLSMTLRNSVTITHARRAEEGVAADEITLAAESDRAGAKAPDDRKARAHLSYLRQLLHAELGPLAPLVIHSRNTFPSACGIASSASGLAALTIAALAAWTEAEDLDALARRGFSRVRLAAMARRGSGSACRSLYGGYVEWTVADESQAGDADSLQSVNALAPAEHWQLSDLIVVIDDRAKETSSTAGHSAAWTSPLFASRLAGLPNRLDKVKAALARRDLEQLGDLMETEALEMHAVMLTGTPAAHYVTEKTSALISWLRTARRRGDVAAWMTLDAGPNPHLLLAPEDAPKVMARLAEAFPNVRIIADGTGAGPSLGAHALLDETLPSDASSSAREHARADLLPTPTAEVPS